MTASTHFRFLCTVNVLILHQHFNTPQSGGALRSYFLARAAIQQGHTVTVVTGGGKKFHQHEFEGICIHELPVAYSNYFGFWKRVISFLKYVGYCVWLSHKFKSTHVCYAISTPLTVGLAARWLKWRHNIPYIFEVGDLWPDAAIELDVITNPLLKKVLWAMEKKIYRKAKCVVALSPAIQAAIEKKTPGVKVHMIPNMADTDFFQFKSESAELEKKKLGLEDKVVISYFGAMGFANGLDYLLRAAQACQEAQLPVHFILAGDGVERSNLQQLARQLNLNNLSFQQFQNREGIRALMHATDVVFVCYQNKVILETGSPNKFFDGLAAGKPVMINFSGWLRTEIEINGCGYYVDPTKPEVVRMILTSLNSSKLGIAGMAALQLAKEKYSRAKLSHAWLNCLS